MSLITTAKDKYNSFSAPVKASFWFTVCGVIQRGISVLTTPIFTRLLTTSQYGVFSVYLSWYDIISVFATLNLFYGAYNNAMTKYPDDRPRITSSMQGLTTTLTVALFIIYLTARKFWNGIFKLDSIYMYAMFAEMLFLPGFNFWAANERYDYRYRKLIWVTLIIVVGSPLLGIAAVMLTSHKAEARVLSYVLVQVGVGLALYLHNLSKGKEFYVGKYWKYALVLNVPLIPHYLSNTILNQADRIMINNMVGTGEAAIYSVAYSAASVMTIITTAIKNTYTPYLYKSLKDKRYDSVREVSSALILLVGVFTMFAMLLGPEIIAIFASKEYYAAIWVIPPVACAVFFKFMYPMFSTAEFYYEKTGFILVASCVGAVTNIILNYFFIRRYGYYAAGYTTLFCYILFSLGHYIFQRRIMRAQEDERSAGLFDVRMILLVSVLLLGVMVGILMLYKTYLPRYAICLALLVGLFRFRDRIIQMIKKMKARGSETN